MSDISSTHSLFIKLQAIFKRVDQSAVFQLFVIAIILVSALSVGAHTYELHPLVERVLHFLDYFITIFFLIELVIRYIAVGDFKKFFSKGWNIFDFIIVVGSLLPASGSSILIARLLRIFRVLRLVSMIPELRILVNALLKAIPQMGYIGLLMFVIFYIYGAIGSMFFANINPDLWSDVSISMLTLFRIATFEDWTDVMYETMEVYRLSWIYYLTFIFLTAFIFLNMMVGTVLEVMSQEHKEARELKKQKAQKKKNENLPATAEDIQMLLAKIDELQQEIKSQK